LTHLVKPEDFSVAEVEAQASARPHHLRAEAQAPQAL
jgi:hypothetical protein